MIRFLHNIQLSKTQVSLLAVLVVGFVGSTIVFTTKAATPIAAVEAESGTIGTGATVLDDATASGAKAVKFSTPVTPASFDPGNPSGTAAVPPGMGLEDVSQPDHIVGTGTAASCTSAAVLAAVTAGGVVTFNCGSSPVAITLTQTAKVRNSTAKLVLDGGGLVTLSGGGMNRILYIDTCDTSLGSVSGN